MKKALATAGWTAALVLIYAWILCAAITIIAVPVVYTFRLIF